jgi:hypothetical protein
MRWKPKRRLDWTAGLLMVPIALGVFTLMRVVAPGLSMPVCALIAAAVAVAIVRGGLLLARDDDALRS